MASTRATRRLWAISAAAIGLALVTGSARAEDARLIFEARGGWLSGDEQPWVDGVNGIGFIDAESILGGTVGIITQAGDTFAGFDDWDVGLFARLGLSNEEDQAIGPDTLFQVIGGDFSTDYTRGRAEHRERQAVIDLEARRAVSWGQTHGAETTLKLGARFAYFAAQTKTDFVFDPNPVFTLQDDRKSEFIGVGPRVAVETSIPLHDRVWLDLGAGASLLFGQRLTTNVTIGDLGFQDETFARSSFRLVPALEARAALKFALENSPATLSVGVEANAWFGLYDLQAMFGPPPTLPGNTNADRFEISPFVNLTMPLGGDHWGTELSPERTYDTSTTAPVLEASLWGGGTWRSGNALNQGGSTPDEDGDFGLAGLSALAAFRLHDDWIAQAEISGETRLGSDTINGVALDDTFEGGFSAGGQLAWTRGPWMFGVFGGGGQVDIASEDAARPQDADHWFAGAQGRIMVGNYALAVQAGHLDTSAFNREVISNALFGRVIGQMFFNDGRTRLQGELAHASGEQDEDDLFFTNPITVTSWGLELEHQLERSIGGAQVSAFLAYQGAAIRERSSFGDRDRLTDATILAGLRVRTGAATPLERARSTAPDMPNVVRWIGATPAVD